IASVHGGIGKAVDGVRGGGKGRNRILDSLTDRCAGRLGRGRGIGGRGNNGWRCPEALGGRRGSCYDGPRVRGIFQGKDQVVLVDAEDATATMRMAGREALSIR